MTSKYHIYQQISTLPKVKNIYSLLLTCRPASLTFYPLVSRFQECLMFYLCTMLSGVNFQLHWRVVLLICTALITQSVDHSSIFFSLCRSQGITVTIVDVLSNVLSFFAITWHIKLTSMIAVRTNHCKSRSILIISQNILWTTWLMNSSKVATLL